MLSLIMIRTIGRPGKKPKTICTEHLSGGSSVTFRVCVPTVCHAVGVAFINLSRRWTRTIRRS